ncbi:MAG TPA: glycerate kinase [Actinospica sp.]|jgi:glycerate kinase|nr:glycerate kinase [Actinospica sp.]
MPTTVIIAPDKFKGTLDAAEAAERIADGVLRAAPPGTSVRTFPVADGGEGTVRAALASGAGFREASVWVSGPTGQPVRASLAVDEAEGTAVIEMAQASGLAQLPDAIPAALTASSRGTGELIRHAVRELGCRKLVLGVGGSACTDGGAGMLQALGVRLLDAEGVELEPGGAALARLARIEAPEELLPGVELALATDVDNPLLGAHGAAAVYGRQKGASDEDMRNLDVALTVWADKIADTTGEDHRDAAGAGAAGGTGFGALALLGARMRPGIALLLDLLGFERIVAGADLVLTGEGSLDEQSLHGKAPIGVANAARRAGALVAAVAGRVALPEARWREAGFAAVYELVALAGEGEDPFTDAARLARRAGEKAAAELL